MRILFDSRQQQYKTPFGTIRTGQSCILQIDIPKDCGATGVSLMLEDCDERPCAEISFAQSEDRGDYLRWRCVFTQEKGLYFYWFYVHKCDGGFRLFREGNQTNMEAGGKWQLSFLPEHSVPDYARGAVMYQIFPDRFSRTGECDLTEKLTPYTLHERTDETPRYTADAQGNWSNDFYGGNLAGIREKLPYLRELGVDILYLNPVFMAFSNHRYDTADYKRIDPMLGTEADFKALCDEAHRLGMHVILDGVFSHTGSNSVYFDAENRFGGGASHDPNSPYRDWYRFSHYPDQYDAWWGIKTLPNVEELTESYVNYIIEDADSVVAHWMALGADGYRLDVVDELPDEFVRRLKRRIRAIRPDALLIGEVWEDASNKRAYGVSRRYFVDAELDSVMNYPWRKAIIAYAMGRDDGSALGEAVMTIAENYPPQVLSCLMNCLGTHDTPRILTVLGDEFDGSKAEKAERFLSAEQRAAAIARLEVATLLQFTLPGMPSVFYGDEAGLEGFEDPFCRRFYPWGREDTALRDHYAALARLKREVPALRGGDVRVMAAGEGRFAFTRSTERQTARIYVNQSSTPWQLPETGTLRFGRAVSYDGAHATLLANGFCVLLRETDTL